MASSRWWLYVQAIIWRFLMRIGMFIHDIAPPRAPRPSFVRSIPADSGQIHLHFYCPPQYTASRKEGRRLPVVVNFHGGGFTLGCPTDDNRWAQCVLEEVGAVVVSVGYRRAPEHPFPAAVDDGVRALQFLAFHAVELGLDVSRIALSGFSAGGNLAVTVPLRLRSLLEERDRGRNSNSPPNLGPYGSTQNLVSSASASDINIVALFCWYPILDFEESRDHRRAMSINPSKTLPSFFTTLFDESYLPEREERVSPYASPVRATDEVLADALPRDIFLYICEWDMLLKEGQTFVRRLEKINKHVRAMMIEKATHGWDKSPNPFRDQAKVNILYRDACADIKHIFDA
ncbi:catalytic protein [Aspergillus heteromorphus CBS 117.55]|uniref:Catalytic protein n=1 Tax=Aspergillus heteromorphus CBS 117.55 TaxID=1448321 RepID=A0A317WKP3_9EURO|nr:catalytic protein [Aspergillus heteromorphus CBS 117.55]PWY86869.1 catalytic protein [Aspergillus heteromorphus CBS 117.55]